VSSNYLALAVSRYCSLQVFMSIFHMTQCLLYPFVDICVCGLSDDFQHVMMIINLMQFVDFISSSSILIPNVSKRSRDF